MNDEFHNNLDEKLSEVLTGAASSMAEPSFSDCDAFRDWLEEGQHRQSLIRHRKIRRAAMTAAAVFVCVLLLSGTLLLLPGTLCSKLPPSLQVLLTPGEGVAAPDLDREIESGNGNIVIGSDGNGNIGTWTATFASYEDLPEKYQRQIIWFEEMPEGYELVEICICDNLNSVEFVSRYIVDEINAISIKQTVYLNESFNKTILNKYDVEFQLRDTTIYFRNVNNANMYLYVEGKNVISIFDFRNIDLKKIEAMIASAKTGLNKL